jgi:hypothetical protein
MASGPVARINSIVFGQGYEGAYAYADGKFSALPNGGGGGGKSVAVPALVIRPGSAQGSFAVAKVGLLLCVGDIIRTAPHVFVGAEFLIGGRVTIAAEATVVVNNERSIDNNAFSVSRVVKHALQYKMVPGFIFLEAPTNGMPLEIDTNACMMGIKG